MGFHEQKLSVSQVTIKNNSGAAYTQGKLVYEQGYFGNVTDPLGIAAGANGVIDIESRRIIETDQINAADTFTVALGADPAYVYFDEAADLLRDNSGGGKYPVVGILVTTKDANDVITFMPLPPGQETEIFSVVELPITADATTALSFAVGETAFKVVDAFVICDASNAAGTLQVLDSADAAITNAMICDVVNTVVRVTTIDITKDDIADGILKVIANGAADRGRVYVTIKKVA
jgi:hypothetical protein